MSIVDIKNALINTAGDQFTFQNVRLGYARGGRDQVLQFKVKCKNINFNLDPNENQEIVFPGQVNPIDKAIEIALSYRQQIEGA